MNIIILGPQGSGKGTQAEMVAKKFNFDHFDTGRALRKVASLDTQLGKKVHEIVIVKKELVSDRILEEVLRIRLNNVGREQGVVFDGVPRNLEQKDCFENALRDFGREVDKVFFIKISEEESIERIAKRRVCEKCKKIFIFGKDIKNEKEKCFECGGRIVQRADDTEEGVRKRLGIFKNETLPMIEYYKKEGKAFEINGNQKVEEVFNEILKKI